MIELNNYKNNDKLLTNSKEQKSLFSKNLELNFVHSDKIEYVKMY